MEVYSKAMELDPNSDEAKNGEPGLLNPPHPIYISCIQVIGTVLSGCRVVEAEGRILKR